MVHNCPVCGPLDGKVFDLGQGQRPPAHPNCRCTAVPVLKSWDEIIGRKVDPSKIPVGTRASMDGQVPADLTFNQWLKQQPLDGIADVLGSKKAARLFKAGELKLDQFSTATGKPLSLKQVMALEGM